MHLKHASRKLKLKVNFVSHDVGSMTNFLSLCMCVCPAGSVFLHDCPGQSIIPIWLIVFGCVSLLQTTINIVKRFFKKKPRRDEEEGDQANYANRTGSCFESLVSIFLFVWIILGSYWVFGYYYVWRANRCNNDPSIECYCHPVPYLFSYIVLIVIYVTSCIFCLCCCCTFLIIALTATAA